MRLLRHPLGDELRRGRATTEFFEEYFGLHYQGGNKGMGFMFDDELSLRLCDVRGRSGVPAGLHVGFTKLARVRLMSCIDGKDDGLPVTPPEHARGYTLCVKSPGGFRGRGACLDQ